MNKKILIRITALISLFMMQISLGQAATFDLQRSLTEGGEKLIVDPNRFNPGVKLGVTSSNIPYEIIQNIGQSFTNDKDPQAVLGDYFRVWALGGANIQKVRIPMNDPGVPVRPGEELKLYVDTQGISDNFTLIYGIKDPDKLKPGTYSGQLTYTIQPINAPENKIVRYLYVDITIPERATSVEISPLDNQNKIYINPQKEDKITASCMVKISGSSAKSFSIMQSLVTPFEPTEGNGQLDEGLIKVTTQNVDAGMGIQNANLSLSPQIVYTPDPHGKADDNFIITYSLGDFSQVKAGRYRSQIQYYISDEEGTQKKINMLAFEVENPAVFELAISQENALGRIQFDNLKPDEPPRISEVTIEIKTNMGKPYQVNQKLLSALTNKEGLEIPANYFTLYTQNIDNADGSKTKGTIRIPAKEAVKAGDTLLFVSDNKGSSDKFKAVYEISPSWDIKAGDYSSSITYSLLEK